MKTSMVTPLSLYLHIPFCTVRCTYCAFNTYVNLESLIQPFTNALVSEIEYLSQSNSGFPVHTIYFGGGTPSLLSHTQIGHILDTIRKGFDLEPNAEISMEANPDDIHIDYVQAVLSQGINRLSLGMQSANNHELKLFGRRHDAEAVNRAVSDARQAGVSNLNLDLIYGLPQQSLADWDLSLNEAMALSPEHLSLYSLGLEEGTAMESWVTNGKLPVPDDDLTADMYELADSVLANHGYEQYEISNWSLPGKTCLHNEQYWLNKPYPGLGPGAHGYVADIRYETVASPHRYIKLLLNESSHDHEFPLTPAVKSWVVLDKETEIAETLLMGLRLTQRGIDRAVFRQRFGDDLMALRGTVINRFVDSGLLYLTDTHVRLTNQGRFLSNMIFRELV
jgi:oxygen-independent coproporphyrinogen-3 oxidase